MGFGAPISFLIESQFECELGLRRLRVCVCVSSSPSEQASERGSKK